MAAGQPLYGDGRHYDLLHAPWQQDIDFWLDCARRFGGPVLDLACGTGRVALPLARAGFAVTGLDLAPGMLTEAARKCESEPCRPRFVAGDMRAFTLGQRFRTVIIAFNSIAHLHTREDVERCLACVRAHLADGGALALALINPRVDLLARRAGDVREITRYADPDSNEEVVVSERVRYDSARQLCLASWQACRGGHTSTQELALRVYFPQELAALLHYNGFAIESRHGDFAGRPFADGAPQQVVVARTR
jgi:SAM-dependent methyltransferase